MKKSNIFSIDLLCYDVITTSLKLRLAEQRTLHRKLMIKLQVSCSLSVNYNYTLRPWTLTLEAPISRRNFCFLSSLPRSADCHWVGPSCQQYHTEGCGWRRFTHCSDCQSEWGRALTAQDPNITWHLGKDTNKTHPVWKCAFSACSSLLTVWYQGQQYVCVVYFSY